MWRSEKRVVFLLAIILNLNLVSLQNLQNNVPSQKGDPDLEQIQFSPKSPSLFENLMISFTLTIFTNFSKQALNEYVAVCGILLNVSEQFKCTAMCNHKLCNYVQKNLQFPGHHLEAESDGEWMTNS